MKGRTVLQACGEHQRFPRQDFESWVACLGWALGASSHHPQRMAATLQGANPRRVLATQLRGAAGRVLATWALLLLGGQSPGFPDMGSSSVQGGGDNSSFPAGV